MATAFVQNQNEEDVTDETAKFIQDRLECGFDFSLANRNALLFNQGMKLPKFTKTGTTIAGIVFKDGVVLGADTRATAGPIVAQKNCEKIHYIAPNIYCCGAGTAADTENVTEMIASQLALMRLNTSTESRVVVALTRLKRYLFRYMGYVSAALVLGGVDSTGPHLHTVWPQGSTSTLPYVTMGSGSLAAMAVFEKEYTAKEDIDEEQAMQLVQNAILSGINNDLGSGSNVDLCVITRDKTEFHRNIFKTQIPHKKDYRYTYPKGTTQILSREVVEFDQDDYELQLWNTNFKNLRAAKND
jgi:20S proteasome subunit beta 2